MDRQDGFTLIELSLVIAIIAIVAAIAVPSFVATRIESNESSAIQNLRSISTSEIGYHASRGAFGTLDELNAEPPGGGPPFLNGEWSDGIEKNGYLFTMDSATESEFVCYADPTLHNRSGRRYFRVDTSGIIRYDFGGRPAVDASPIH